MSFQTCRLGSKPFSNVRESRFIEPYHSGRPSLLGNTHEALIVKCHQFFDDCSVKRTFEGKLSKSGTRAANDAADGSEKEQPKVHQKGGRHQLLVTQIVIFVFV